MSLYSDLSWGRRTEVSQAELNRRAKIVADAIEALREFSPNWQAEVNALRDIGLERINDALIPAYQQIIELANLGALLSSPSSTAVEIGVGIKTFVLPESKRETFAPTPFLMAVADGDFDQSMIGLLSGYDLETGTLTIAVERFSGEGVHSDWQIGPVATTDDLEALRDEVEASTIAANTHRMASLAAAQDAASSATAAHTSKIATDANLADMRETAGKPGATPPADPNEGQLWYDTGTKLVRVWDGETWSPAVTASIGGLRLEKGEFGPDPDGIITVGGGFKFAMVFVNGVILRQDEDYTVSGDHISVLDPAEGEQWTVWAYQAIDAADYYPKEEVNARLDDKLNKDGSNLVTPAEQGAVRAAIGGDVLGGFRNKIINGDFDIWQRGTTIATGTYCADRWRYYLGGGGPGGVSRMNFNAGYDLVPGNPEYYARLQITQAGTSQPGFFHRIEGVRTLAGKKATLTAYIRLGASSTVETFLSQKFGTGGSPDVSTPIEEAALPAGVFQKVQTVIDVPSIYGKTIGGDGNDSLEVIIRLPVGYVGVLDLAHVSLVEGDATWEVDPFSPRHIQQELALCQRYFQTFRHSGVNIAPSSGSSAPITVVLPVRLRAAPTSSKINNGIGIIGNGSLANIQSHYPEKVDISVPAASIGNVGTAHRWDTALWHLDAEL